MQCVLAGTDPAACDVGTIPAANPITLAPGVTGEDCPEPSVDTDGSLKIEGDGNSGRLMAFHNGEWGTVCDDYFDTNNNGADVACRQMGYASGTYSPDFRGSEPDESVLKIVYDDIQCTGTEARIQECPGIRDHTAETANCNHGEDAGVVCLSH